MKTFIVLFCLLPILGISQYEVESIDFIPIQTSTNSTNVVFTNGNGKSDVIDLPFSFRFYGRAYSKIKIEANGSISFNASMGGASNPLPQVFPSSSRHAIKNAILVHHDLDPSTGGSVSYDTEGQFPNRRFKVNFIAIPHYGCNELISTFQFILYETTNQVEIRIANKPVCSSRNNGYAAVALHNSVGTEAAIPPGRNSGAWTSTDEAWKFSPDPIELNVDFCWSIGDPMPIYNVEEIVSQSIEFKNLISFTLHNTPQATSGDLIENAEFYILPEVPHKVYIAVSTTKGPSVIGKVLFNGNCKNNNAVDYVYCYSEGSSLPTLDLNSVFIANYKGDINKIASPIRFYPSYIAAYYGTSEINNTSSYTITSRVEKIIVTFLENYGWWPMPRTFELTIRPVHCVHALESFGNARFPEELHSNTVEKVRVYPNPAQNFLRIEGVMLEDTNDLQIYNAQGRLMKKYRMEYNTGKVFIGDFPAGLYAITGQVKGIPFSKKFIKQ